MLTYHLAHYQVQKQRGRARRFPCIDCGQPARQWSYDHTDPHELISPTGLQYSVDPDQYDPRCFSCHRAFDQQHRKAEQETKRAALEDIARPIEADIRHAIRERDKARKRNDLVAIDQWDDELERLTEPLQSAT